MEQLSKRSALIHMFSLAALFILLLIPSFLVDSLVREREGRRNEVLEELRSKWGKQQKVTGPILAVPVWRKQTRKDKSEYTSHQTVHLLPNTLDARAALKPELRRRGIYQAVLYASDLTFTGVCDVSELETWRREGWTVDWKRAALVVGITDLKGIASDVALRWNGRPLKAEAGTGLQGALTSGVRGVVGEAGVPGSSQLTVPVEVHLRLNGGGDLLLAATGQSSSIAMEGNWGTPSFIGEFLPTERGIEGEAFSARWNVNGLNRSLPHSWTGDAPSFDGAYAGVRLLMPIDEYQQTHRASKYAILFIAVMMFAFFVIEAMSGAFLHPIQYGFIALALLVFYVLLLSFSEHIPFAFAYVIAAGAVVALVGSYIRAALARVSHVIGVSALLASLYAYLYVLVQEEDYALLLGSIGLFSLLAVMMFITRKIDWYSFGRSERAL